MGTKSIHQNIFVDLFAQKSTEWCSAIANMVSPWRSSPQGHQLINAIIIDIINKATNLQSTSGAHPPVGEPPANNRPIPCRAKHHPRDVWPHRQVTFANVTNTKIPSKYKQNKADTKDFKANTKKTTTQMQKI